MTLLYRIFLIVIATALFGLPTDSLAATRYKACVKADGRVVVKRRCRASRGETPLNLSEIATVLAGPKGDPGEPGPQGDPGLLNLEHKWEYTVYDSTNFKSLCVTCPEGKTAISGGAVVTGTSAKPVTAMSYRPANGNLWCGWGWETSATSINWQIKVDAMCANVSQ